VTVYEGIVSVSKPYFGPATEQFIARQCQLYLKIEASDLSKTHLAELAKWVEVSGTRFLDEAKSKELAGKIARY
jgi:hypothetical protein